MKVHNVEINFPKSAGKDLFIKIDGKEFKNTSGIVIKSPCANDDGMTSVQITFYAEVKGNIRTDKLGLIQVKGLKYHWLRWWHRKALRGNP